MTVYLDLHNLPRIDNYFLEENLHIQTDEGDRCIGHVYLLQRITLKFTKSHHKLCKVDQRIYSEELTEVYLFLNQQLIMHAIVQIFI